MATNIYIKQNIEFSDDLLGSLFLLIIVCILNRKFVKHQTFSYNLVIKKQRHATCLLETLITPKKEKKLCKAINLLSIT